MRIILADENCIGWIDALVREMMLPPWREFWDHEQLALAHFADVGLPRSASDLEVLSCCRANGLILLTDNRNGDADDSITAGLSLPEASNDLPVMTISSIERLRSHRDYRFRVIEALLTRIMSIDSLRGTGRIYIP